jgi:ferric-dicitrate binding protein FerR (iron transport regulator)
MRELNRYNRGKVILVGDVGDVGEGKKVSATFGTDDAKGLVDFLKAEWRLEGRSIGEDWVVDRR